MQIEQRIGWGAAAFVFALHAALAGRYDFFRDELYFIICGRHPAFGYVDQPPLVPLIAAATQAFGDNLVLLRLIPALFAAGTVFIACALARLAGGRAFAVTLTALFCGGFATMYLGLQSTFNTTAHEPFIWTLVAYGLARCALLDDRRALVWTGVAIGIGTEAKYGIAFWLASLAVGVLGTPARRMLLTREAALGTALAVIIGAPSILWQALHGWPIIELLRNGADGKNVVLSPLAFIGTQMLDMNLALAAVWMTGVIAPFLIERLRPLRFIAIAFATLFVMMLVLHGKDYYLAAAYPGVFAIGAIATESFVRKAWERALWLVPAFALCAIAIPVSLPILEPAAIPAYMRAMHLSESGQEKSFAGAALPQLFGDQVDWRRMVHDVARVYQALPPSDRARAALITSNYGEAAAIDFYGHTESLPPALSGHNAYWSWGTHGYDGSVILRINGNIKRYRELCRSATDVGRFGGPLAMPYERDAPIVLCRGLKTPLPEKWRDFKHYD